MYSKQLSKTAEELFSAANKSNQYKSAGLNTKYVTKAGSTLCTPALLNWADVTFVFEEIHIEHIQEYTGDKHLSKIINLQVEDKYQFFEREIVQLILERCNLV